MLLIAWNCVRVRRQVIREDDDDDDFEDGFTVATVVIGGASVCVTLVVGI